MRVVECLRATNPSTADLIQRLAEKVTQRQRAKTIPNSSGPIVVFFGGGKDSALSLALSKGIAEMTGCRIQAATMDHPGLTLGTFENIRRVCEVLDVDHHYWHFKNKLREPGKEYGDWRRLYRRLAEVLSLHPRFMCIACNFGSIVTEYSALAHYQAEFRATGNSSWEFSQFDAWTESLKNEFAASVTFPPVLGKPLLDYYRFWYAIYETLLLELFDDAEQFTVEQAVERYLYSLPEPGSIIEQAEPLCVMGDTIGSCTALEHREFLASLGWRLPDDIQGGTESDCALTAAIAHLNIAQNGLERHLRDLNEANTVFKPLPEMIGRARTWASDGTASIEGRKLLEVLEVFDCEGATTTSTSPLAKSLAAKLFKIR